MKYQKFQQKKSHKIPKKSFKKLNPQKNHKPQNNQVGWGFFFWKTGGFSNPGFNPYP